MGIVLTKKQFLNIVKSNPEPVAKLTGAAKTAFLARMAAGRRKAAGKSTKKRSTAAKTTTKRKTNKQKKTKKNVAAKKKKGILDNIPLINNPTFKKAALGVGTATIGVSLLALVAPGIATNPIVRPVLALAGGGVPGVVAQILAQGGLGALTGNLGGNGGNGFNPNFA